MHTNGRRTNDTRKKIITPGDSLPTVAIRNYKTEGKGTQNILKNQRLKKVTENLKESEDTMEQFEFAIMLDIKTRIARTIPDAKLNRVKAAMRRDNKEHATEIN